MKLGNRLRRVEQAIRQQEEQRNAAHSVCNRSDDERVRIVRAVRERVGRLLGAIQDPFPELAGEAYLKAYWPWYLTNGQGWPAWADDFTVRNVSSGSAEMRVYCMRGVLAHFNVSDPFPKLQGQQYLRAVGRLRLGRARASCSITKCRS